LTISLCRHEEAANQQELGWHIAAKAEKLIPNDDLVSHLRLSAGLNREVD
jgi:hypothetical protein